MIQFIIKTYLLEIVIPCQSSPQPKKQYLDLKGKLLCLAEENITTLKLNLDKLPLF